MCSQLFRMWRRRLEPIAAINVSTTGWRGQLATPVPSAHPVHGDLAERIKRHTVYRDDRDVQSNPRVAIVIDDLASIDPWRPRMIEIRGVAEVLPTGGEAIGRGFDPPMSRIRPKRIISIGVEGDARLV